MNNLKNTDIIHKINTNEPDIICVDTQTQLEKTDSSNVNTEVTCVEVAVIGDIHGTTKFIDGYEHILKNNNQVKKIVVMGDHFDPYDDIPLDTMVGRYKDFLGCMKNDNRIVSLLGNHDLAAYIIKKDETSRTAFGRKSYETISSLIESNLENSRLMYKCGNYLFSHAGVSDVWVEKIAEPISFDFEKLNKVGWNQDELTALVKFYPFDFSGYGNNPNQGPTWLRPYMLIKYPYGDYNQVVGHTMVCYEDNRKFLIEDFGYTTEMDGNFYKAKMENGKYVWFTDNAGDPEYLVLKIEKQC